MLVVVCCLTLFATAAVAADGYLKAKVQPGRAGLFVDGKYIGPAKNFGSTRKYPLAEGEHEIKLVEPRYEDVTKRVTVSAGKVTVVREDMKALPLAKPPFGLLRTKGPEKFAAVYVNDKFFGHVDEFDNFAQGIQLSPGSYAVKIVPVSGGAPHEEKVTIEANKTTIVRVK